MRPSIREIKDRPFIGRGFCCGSFHSDTSSLIRVCSSFPLYFFSPACLLLSRFHPRFLDRGEEQRSKQQREAREGSGSRRDGGKEGLRLQHVLVHVLLNFLCVFDITGFQVRYLFSTIFPSFVPAIFLLHFFFSLYSATPSAWGNEKVAFKRKRLQA